MAKFNPVSLSEKTMGQLISEFYKAVTLIEAYDEAKSFFKDLLTPTEMSMLTRRLQIAKMLEEGYPYEAIELVLKVGTQTIAKVARWLNYGGGGYRLIIQRMIELEKKELKKRNKRYSPFDTERIKRVYAGYYWPEEAMKMLEEKLAEYLKLSRKISSIPKEAIIP